MVGSAWPWLASKARGNPASTLAGAGAANAGAAMRRAVGIVAGVNSGNISARSNDQASRANPPRPPWCAGNSLNVANSFHSLFVVDFRGVVGEKGEQTRAL